MLKEKKIISVFLVLVFIIAVTAGCSSNKTAEEYIEASNLKSAELDNFEMDIEMDMSMNIGEEVIDVQTKGNGVIFQNPMKMKMELTTQAMGEEVQITQYMEQTEDAMIVYQYIMGEWQKMTISDLGLIEMMSMNPADRVEAYMNSLVSAEIIGEENVGERQAVKIEMVMSGEMYDEILGQTGGINLPDVQIDENFFKALGELKAIVWIDKKTDDMLKMSMDMSENMAGLMEYFLTLDDINDEELEALKGMTVKVVYEMRNQNKASDFAIPEEAKAAPEMSLNS